MAQVFSCRDLGFNLPCLLEVERLEGAKLERLPPVPGPIQQDIRKVDPRSNGKAVLRLV